LTLVEVVLVLKIARELVRLVREVHELRRDQHRTLPE
jgi:hypothetical protein